MTTVEMIDFAKQIINTSNKESKNLEAKPSYYEMDDNEKFRTENEDELNDAAECARNVIKLIKKNDIEAAEKEYVKARNAYLEYITFKTMPNNELKEYRKAYYASNVEFTRYLYEKFIVEKHFTYDSNYGKEIAEDYEELHEKVMNALNAA